MQTVIESDKVKKDIHAKVYSDLHYIPDDNLSFLNRSVTKMEFDRPDYIFFLGDLIDDSSLSKEQLEKFYDLIYRMSKLSNVILTLGNHDQFSRNQEGEWIDNYNIDFINSLKERGAIVLQNELYQDEFICAYGMQFPGSYYENGEPLMEFLQNARNVEFSDFTKFNILLEHSPKHTFNGELVSSLDNFKNIDLTLAGHFHNGCIPWYIDKLMLGNFGLIDPNGNLFPKNARGNKYITDTNYGIISSPIILFPRASRLNTLQFFNFPKEQHILIKKKSK